MTSPAELWLNENGTAVKPLPTTTTEIAAASVGRFSGIVNRPMASLRRLWTDFYLHGAFGQEGAVIPGSGLRFVVGGLLSLIEIKSQGQSGFPFRTHPHTVMIAVTCLLMYGLASGAQHAISAAAPGPNSVYAVIARWGKMVCVYILYHRAMRMRKLTAQLPSLRWCLVAVSNLLQNLGYSPEVSTDIGSDGLCSVFDIVVLVLGCVWKRKSGYTLVF